MKTDKPYEWRVVEDFTIVASMVIDSYAETAKLSRSQTSSTAVPLVSDRLIRKFLPVYLPSPAEAELISVFNAVLQFEIQSSEGLSLDEDIQKSIVDASSHVVSQITNVLRASTTPGRQHYVFSMNDILRSYKVPSLFNQNPLLLCNHAWKTNVSDARFCQRRDSEKSSADYVTVDPRTETIYSRSDLPPIWPELVQPPSQTDRWKGLSASYIIVAHRWGGFWRWGHNFEGKSLEFGWGTKKWRNLSEFEGC